MRIRPPAWICGAALLLPLGCRCGTPDPEPVGRDPKVAEVPVAPPPVASELPAERPKRFSVSYSREPEPEHKENLLLGNVGARQGSRRGRRSVAVYYSPSGPIVDEVYGALREYACDRVDTEVRRGEPRAGAVIQMTAGALRRVINENGAFHPKKEWAGALEGCLRALDTAFPDPGTSGYTELEIRFPGDQIPNHMSIETDLGPDHRGIEWRDDDATAIVYVAKIRPVDIQVACGGGKTTVSVDLATARGVELAAKPDASEEELAAVVTVLDEPAVTKGNVLTGGNARIQPRGAERLDLAGEPAERPVLKRNAAPPE